MRIIDVSKKWGKLSKPIGETFTTFRFPWTNDFAFQVGDKVQLVFKPRSKEREILGTAEIVDRILVDCSDYSTLLDGYYLSDVDAVADGFLDARDMKYWLRQQYGQRINKQPMIKYTLRWIERR